jgi:hypothetical protein
MSTTTTTTNTGGILAADQLAWLPGDWIEAFTPETYEASVIWAAGPDGLLSSSELLMLLASHGFAIPTLAADLEACRAAGHPTADLRHAGQALVWLGY